jgi:biotin carboxyl carrier protein
MIDIKDIRRFQSLFSGEDIDEIEIRHGKDAVRITIGPAIKKGPKAAVKEPARRSDGNKNEENKRDEDKTPEIKETPAKYEVQEKGAIYELKSQWIGFFTRLNPKTGENYIKLRDIVKKGDIVGHVRVLGVLQDIRSEFKGKVKEVLVEEGQPIEYGQPVMRLEIQGDRD